METIRHNEAPAVAAIALSARTKPATLAALEEAGVSEFAQGQIWRLVEFAQAAKKPMGVSELSEKTKIPQGTLSQLISGKYPGNYDARARRIEQFFYDEENRRLFGGCRDFVQTQVAKSLWHIFDKTRYNRRIQIIQSEEQLGKTRAADEYTHAHNSGRTIMITLKPGGSNNPFGVFMRDLARTLGLSVDHVKAMDLRFEIQDELKACDLIIMDEVHQLEHWPDKAVKDFLDYTRIELHDNGKRGIIWIATNSDVMGLLNAFKSRARYNVGQLLGRMCNQILELYPDEIPLEDVRDLVERYYKPSKATLGKLYDLCCRPKLGHFGLLDDIMGRAWSNAQIEKIPLTDEMVTTIAQETMKDIERRKEMHK